VASVKPRPRFIPGNGPPIPIGKEAGCASELVWTQRIEDKFFRGSNSGRPVCSQTLYWLSYPSFLALSVKRTVMQFSSSSSSADLEREQVWQLSPLRIPQLAPPSSLIASIPDWSSSSRSIYDISLTATYCVKAGGGLLFLRSFDPSLFLNTFCLINFAQIDTVSGCLHTSSEVSAYICI
jgi:hypothetical protein